MVRFLISHSTSVFVFYAALCLLSIISLAYLPVSLLPEVSVPQIKIQVDGPNKSPNEIETQILSPIRRTLLQLDGIQDFNSTARFEKGEINLKFDYGKNVDYAYLEVNEKIDLATNSLPRQVQRPRVIRQRAADIPTFFLAISYKESVHDKDFFALSEFVSQVMRRQLEQLPEVAISDIHGQIGKQIVIVPDQNLINNLGITIKDLIRSLEDNQLTFGSVKFQERNFEYLVQIGEEIQSIKKVKSTPIVIDNRIFQLSDLAKITIEKERVTGRYMVNGEPAVNLAIIKSKKAKVKELRKKISSLIETIKRDYPELEIHISRDNTKLLTVTINNLEFNLYLGCFLAFFLVFLFYRNWRNSILIGITIPISVFTTLLFFSIFDLSINIVTLSGLILGLGLMIDNGIIILDNIIQEFESNNIESACIKGVNEMIRPLLASLLTTCSVFLPLIFISGITGELFYEQALSITLGLVLSYIVSITFIPVAYFVLEKKHQIRKKSNFAFTQKYSKLLDWLFKFKTPFLVLLILIIGTGVYIFLNTPKSFLPKIPSPSFEIFIDWKSPINLMESENRTQYLIKGVEDQISLFDSHEGIDQYLIYQKRTSTPTTSQLYFNCKDLNQIPIIKEQIASNIKTFFPEAEYEFLQEESEFNFLFPKEKEDIIVGIFLDTKTFFEQREIIDEFSNNLRDQFSDIDISTPAINKNVLLSPKNEMLLNYKIGYFELYEKLKQVTNGIEVFSITESQNETSVILSNNSYPSLYEILKNEQISNEEGMNFSFINFIDIKNIYGWEYTSASKEGVYIPLRIKTKQPKEVISYLELKRDEGKTNFSIIYAAQYQNQKLLTELSLIFIVAIILLFLIMTIQFESFIYPLIILFELPISLSGSVFFLYLFGSSINIMALIGMVVTAGIVINDSIIKIDTINNLFKQGNSLELAIHKGGIKRLNAILMTSATTILAVIPIFFSNSLGAYLQLPLALALSGGLLIGTIMSLFLIPILYSLINKSSSNKY